jgi:hypothetical protein
MERRKSQQMRNAMNPTPNPTPSPAPQERKKRIEWVCNQCGGKFDTSPTDEGNKNGWDCECGGTFRAAPQEPEGGRLEKERVASVLRKLKDTPNALLFINDGSREWTWDMPDILGIPVFHIAHLYPNDDRDCPWLPLYSDDRETDGYRFRRIYEDYL